jgi:hypothetical protein
MSGGSKFSVKQITNTDSACDAVLHVSSSQLSIAQLISESVGHTADEIRSNYTINYPKIIINPLNTKKITFLFTENSSSDVLEEGVFGFDKRVVVECLSRHSRDLIVLTIRAYAVRNYLINSDALNLLFHTEHKHKLSEKDWYISGLTNELSRTRDQIYQQIAVHDNHARD